MSPKTLAEIGLHIYCVTKDPLTFSAAQILLQYVEGTPKGEAVLTAEQLLRRQYEAYSVLFSEPLV